jgi:hypothetical protein
LEDKLDPTPDVRDRTLPVELRLDGAIWLLCNGAPLRQADFPELHTAIGCAHGDGTELGGVGFFDFNLPDMRGMFLRGVSGPFSRRDPDADNRGFKHSGGNIGNKVGSFQDSAFRSHSHPLSNRIIGDTMGGFGHIDAGDHGHSGSIHDLGIRRTEEEGASETRPINAYVNWIIKAKTVA